MPLLRHFPHDIPADTTQLWFRKVLTHFAQASNQPCLFCHREGCTHVMNPCHHVVCDVCFDGSNYSACPVCGKQVDTSSPFFQAVLPRQPGKESMPLKLLHLGSTREQHASALLRSLCERKQALSPEDRAALKLLVQEMGASALSSLPATITVRENVALVFGTLLQQLDAASVMQAAQAHFNSATDVLRLLAVWSGVDPALQGESVYRMVPTSQILTSRRYRALRVHREYFQRQTQWQMASVVKRFKLAKLARPLRRAVLGFMETLAPAQLTEDMLRHRSYWVWLGQFLHPHEYQKRFPVVAKAFAIVRKKAPDGTRAPWPDGASEFVDIDLAAASAEGIRYCVAVLNNYSGQAFDELERGFAGLMYRNDLEGLHFDPRTVALRFDLAGKNGVFLPLVIDLARLRLAQGRAQASMPFGPECPVWAALDHGDLVLPEGSTCYALRPGSSMPGMAAADLLV